MASDILDRYAEKLAQVRTQATPEQYRTVREDLIKRDLDEHINSVLLVDALRTSLEKKQLKKLDEYIDEVFEQRVVELKKEFKVDTRAELEELLEKQGTSLGSLRDSFANSQMASQFFKEKTKTKQVIGRPEMMRYYNAHIADYKTTARVRWQEIQISFAKHGGKTAAFSVVEKIVQALKNRDNFAVVAKKYSDGSTATEGGQWDWTQIGSLTDKKIERALFELPVNDISRVYTGESAFKIVKINAREATRFTPFGEVQKQIKATLEQQAREANGKKVFEELRKNAVITRMFASPRRTEEPRVKTISNERPRKPNPFERR